MEQQKIPDLPSRQAKPKLRIRNQTLLSHRSVTSSLDFSLSNNTFNNNSNNNNSNNNSNNDSNKSQPAEAAEGKSPEKIISVQNSSPIYPSSQSGDIRAQSKDRDRYIGFQRSAKRDIP